MKKYFDIKEQINNILQEVDETNNEINSATDNLPMYDSNESTRSHLSNAEQSINNIEDMLLDLESVYNRRIEQYTK